MALTNKLLALRSAHDRPRYHIILNPIQVIKIHPASTLSRRNVATIVYDELVCLLVLLTKKLSVLS
jgi:hypothetical protein